MAETHIPYITKLAQSIHIEPEFPDEPWLISSSRARDIGLVYNRKRDWWELPTAQNKNLDVSGNMTNAFWSGIPVQAERGTAIVADMPHVPAYWAREFIGTRRAVVKIYGTENAFYIDDFDGKGWTKVTEHRGSPIIGHSELAIEPGSFIEDGGYAEPAPEKPLSLDIPTARPLYLTVTMKTTQEGTHGLRAALERITHNVRRGIPDVQFSYRENDGDTDGSYVTSTTPIPTPKEVWEQAVRATIDAASNGRDKPVNPYA